MTYPPDKHLVRDLRVTMERPQPGYGICSCELVPEICNADGQPRLGVLAALIDMAGAGTAIGAVAPDWIATSDLSCSAGGSFGSGPIVVTVRVLRVGANIAVVRAEIGDGAGDDDPATMVPAGVGLMKFARIPASASEVSRDRVPAVSPRQSNATPGSGFRAALHEQIGLRVVDAASGVVEVDKSDYVRNSFGSLNGGVLAITAEAAAETALGGCYRATDLQVHYLAQTRRGPARSRVRMVRADRATAAVEVDIVDAGNDSLLLTTNSVVLRAV